jgi:hypothetical protein
MWTEMRTWERRHYRECYADNHVDLVQQVKIRQRRHQPTQLGALVARLAEREYKEM